MDKHVNVYRILSIKDVISLLECSHSYAVKVRKDIKEELKVPIVLVKHFNAYFKV